MMPIRRSAGRVATRQLRAQPQRQPQQRRFVSDDHGSHGHAAPANEPLGLFFYLAFGAVPVSYAIYTISRPSADGQEGYVTRLINQFTTTREEWERKNTLHTAMVEQAAFDRNLLNNEPARKNMELKFQEAFNTGMTEINVPAGHFTNIDKVIEHYKQKNQEQDAKTKKRAEEGWTYER